MANLSFELLAMPEEEEVQEKKSYSAYDVHSFENVIDGVVMFLLLIFFGYICGIAGKLMSPTFKWYVLFFYVLNFTMVGLDLLLYVRNYRIDKKNKQLLGK